MQRHARSLLPQFSLAVFVLSAAGCQCHHDPGTADSYADMNVVWSDVDGTVRVNRNATYNFGTAFVGDSIEKEMTVRNLGTSNLTLTSLVQASGVATTIGSTVAPNAYYTVKFTPPITVAPSSDVTFDMTFTPQVGVQNPVSVLTLTGDGTRPEDNTATITLTGVGQGGICDLPSVLDFGDVPLGAHFVLDWVFKNPAAIAATANVGTITGADALSFTSDTNGDLPLPAMNQAQVNFTFSPTEIRAYTAQVTMKGPGDCPQGNVTLKGNGANTVLSWTPTSIDYGYVSPNISAPRDVIFTNTSNVPIVLTNVQTGLPSDFAYLNDATDTPTTFTVAGGGTSHLTVACRPAGLGARSTTLEFDTGLADVPHGSIDLKCYGGGPSILVTPRPTLAFGQVGLFPASSTYQVTRKVTVENVGSTPPNNDPTANLFLGTVDPVAGPGQFPLYEITPNDANTLTGEFSVLLGQYNNTTGLPAIVGQNLVDLSVILQPQTVGMKTATLTIHSNDPVEPTILITVTADVEMLPPCNLAIAPTSLNFGLVTPPDQKQLGVVVTNLGQNANDTCYLSGIEIGAGSDPAFSIVGGNVDSVELQPGQVMTINVQVWPMGMVPAMTQTLVGQLHFNVASPTTPQVIVPLQASIGPVCLTVVPSSFDYGNVKQGCGTSAQQFTAYNTCGSDIFIQSITMEAAAGQAAGGPNCPAASNPTGCPEFTLTSTPTIPTGGLRLAAGDLAQFSAKYKPIDLGSDSGAIAINAIQGGQNVTYLVSLQGLGDTMGQQTDTFVQDLKPLADVLLVVDDSCSMQDKQNSLATNFVSFIQYASTTQADWHIGVTTTDGTPDSQCVPGFPCTVIPEGHLVGNTTNPTVLTPATPNLNSLFTQKVNVGTDGSGTEMGFDPALLALTPPLVTNENAGFLRYDANLAIVVVSDAQDQSPNTYSYYLNRFRNIKGYQRANMFTFNDIGPYMNPPPDANAACQYDDSSDAQTYAQMCSDTNGVKAEICTTDWATALQTLGKTAFGYRTSFFLTATPDLMMGHVITVSIDGTAVPTTQWTYNATSISIDFDPTHTPGPGQTLTVSYYRECLP